MSTRIQRRGAHAQPRRLVLRRRRRAVQARPALSRRGGVGLNPLQSARLAVARRPTRATSRRRRRSANAVQRHRMCSATPSKGLMWLILARQRASGRSMTAGSSDLRERFTLASDEERTQARGSRGSGAQIDRRRRGGSLNRNPANRHSVERSEPMRNFGGAWNAVADARLTATQAAAPAPSRHGSFRCRTPNSSC